MKNAYFLCYNDPNIDIYKEFQDILVKTKPKVIIIDEIHSFLK